MPSGNDSDSTTVDVDSLVAVGQIRRAHGVRGDASVQLLTDSVERLSELDHVFLVDPSRESIEQTRIADVRPHKDFALVRLAGIDSPEALASYRSWTIEIPEEETRELDEDEFFLHDLDGLEVFDESGRSLGKVVAISEGVAQLLLTIEGKQGRFQVPFVEALCPTVDLEERKIVVSLPEGLIELNTKPKGRAE